MQIRTTSGIDAEVVVLKGMPFVRGGRQPTGRLIKPNVGESTAQPPGKAVGKLVQTQKSAGDVAAFLEQTMESANGRTYYQPARARCTLGPERAATAGI